MAKVIAAATTAAIALAASTEKTILQVAANTNQTVKIVRAKVSFNEEIGDATPSIPLLVRFGTHTAASGTGSANSPKAVNNSAMTLRTTALDNFSSVATLTDVFDVNYTNAQTWYEMPIIPGFEPEIANGEVFSINVTPGAVISTGGLNCNAVIWFEE